MEAKSLAYAALHDALTDHPNRVSLQEHLRLALARAERDGRGAAVLFIDVDNFKLINDSFGHAAGDDLLRAVASRLRRSTRAADIVARQGGDEFLILLADLGPPGVGALTEADCLGPAEDAARNVREVLRAPFLVAGAEIYTTASVGISLFPADAHDAETLLKHADIAMYKAKGSGRDGHALYDVQDDNVNQQLATIGRLRQAAKSARGLVLHYQPLMVLETGEMVGVEALLR